MRTFAALPLLLLLSACSADTVTTTLEAAVDAALQSNAFPEYAPYLTGARSCLQDATAILSSSGGAGKKAADIALACSAVAIQSLPASAPPAIVLVASTLRIFLATVTPHNGALADQHSRMRLNAAAMARIRAKVARFK